MAILSVISGLIPSHEQYFREALDAMTSQSLKDWEWVVVLNRGAQIPIHISDDRIKIYRAPDDPDLESRNRIGRIKRFASERASAPLIVEYDIDDILREDALEKIAEAFADPDAHFVYSNDAQFEWPSMTARLYDSTHGWRSRVVRFRGANLTETIAPRVSAQTLRFIYWAPDHVRAWRKTSYNEIGGHDATLDFADDHDLMTRFYLRYGAKGFRHIDECLYFYRVHGENSWLRFNERVQEATNYVYAWTARRMAARWAEDEGLRKLDLGGAFDRWPGFEVVDIRENADVRFDLNESWTFARDNSVGVIKAYHIFEHLRDPIAVMNEAFRILAPGGFLFIEVPSTDGRGAFQDPTHVSFWNRNSFLYYTDKRYSQFIEPRYRGRFLESRIIDYFANPDFEKALILFTQADLIALKYPFDQFSPGVVKI